MMSKDMSIKARDRHVDAYVAQLRASLDADGDTFDQKIVDALADMYRHGWDDADDMIRSWEKMQ